MVSGGGFLGGDTV